MKKQKEEKELAEKKKREDQIAAMDEEEREALLKAEADELEHQKKQDRMLKRQLKTYKSNVKKKKVGGRREHILRCL